MNKLAHDSIRATQMLEAFKVYRSTALVDFLDRPRTYAFVDGVVIRGVADVVSADPAGLVLQVEPRQTTALERAQTVLLESPLHGASYRATVDLVDHARALLSLSDLEPYGTYHEKRTAGRAAPSIPLLAKVHGHGHTATGRVVDVSICSLAVDFERRSFERVARAPLVRLDVWGEESESCPLPDFEITAEIKRHDGLSSDEGGPCRAVLAFEPYPALDRALRRYVAGRQREVMIGLATSDGDASRIVDAAALPERADREAPTLALRRVPAADGGASTIIDD